MYFIFEKSTIFNSRYKRAWLLLFLMYHLTDGRNHRLETTEQERAFISLWRQWRLKLPQGMMRLLLWQFTRAKPAKDTGPRVGWGCQDCTMEGTQGLLKCRGMLPSSPSFLGLPHGILWRRCPRIRQREQAPQEQGNWRHCHPIIAGKSSSQVIQPLTSLAWEAHPEELMTLLSSNSKTFSWQTRIGNYQPPAQWSSQLMS